MRISPLILLASGLCLVSCETTGDPSQGGLFGWSQPKADQRIYQKESELSRLQSNTAYQRQRSSSLRSTYNSMR